MKFYKLYSDDGKRKKFAFAITLGGFDFERIHCQVCGRKWTKDRFSDYLSIALSNDNFPDFVHQVPYKFLSAQAYEMIAKEHIGSCSFQGVEVVPKSQLSKETLKELRYGGENVSKIAEDPPMYYFLKTNIQAKIHKNSNLEFAECKACGYFAPYTPGKPYVDTDSPLYLDSTTWDGSDLFAAEHFPLLIFCTERFVNLYNQYNLTGLQFEEAHVI